MRSGDEVDQLMIQVVDGTGRLCWMRLQKMMVADDPDDGARWMVFPADSDG